MKTIFLFLSLFLPLFLFSSCRSITFGHEEFNIPPKTVIFSFDDGPNAHDNTTERLLDVLKKYEVRAMFALLGEKAEIYPELVRRIYDEGHIIINHGYADKMARTMNDDEFRDNLIRGGNAISAALGENQIQKLYRPHYGFYTSRQNKICAEEGYAIIPGNIRVYDAVLSKENMDRIIRKVVNKAVREGSGIILLHDARGSNAKMEKELEKKPNGAYNRSWIPDAVEKIIIELNLKGFTSS